MTYRETARAFVAAEYGQSANALPLYEWAEIRRDAMSPQTIAAYHAVHVESAAHDLRRDIDILEVYYLPEIGKIDDDGAAYHNVWRLIESARTLLRAIGEGEGE